MCQQAPLFYLLQMNIFCSHNKMCQFFQLRKNRTQQRKTRRQHRRPSQAIIVELRSEITTTVVSMEVDVDICPFGHTFFQQYLIHSNKELGQRDRQLIRTDQVGPLSLKLFSAVELEFSHHHQDSVYQTPPGMPVR